MTVQLGWFALGLVLLVLGADSFIRGAAGVALRFGIRPFVVGMVLVGVGTSAPELAVNLTAVLDGRYDLAVGNIVGSNIANIGLILGTAALLAPLVVQMRLLRVETPLLIGVSVLLWVFCLDGVLGRIEGAVLLAGFLALMVYVLRDARSEPAPVQQELAEIATTRPELPRNLLRVLVGGALLVYAANLMVGAAVVMARGWGISDLVIGLTVVAIGTSLPELAASVMAAWRRQADIAVGNVIGSCLFNAMLILGLTATIHPLSIARSLLWVELPAMIAFALALYPLTWRDQCVERHEGAVLLLAFTGFMGWQAWMAFG